MSTVYVVVDYGCKRWLRFFQPAVHRVVQAPDILGIHVVFWLVRYRVGRRIGPEKRSEVRAALAARELAWQRQQKVDKGFLRREAVVLIQVNVEALCVHEIPRDARPLRHL